MSASALFLLVSLSAPPATAETPFDDHTVLAWVADLSSEDGDRRRAAIQSLTKAGPKAKAAVPALVKLLDPQNVHRFEAADILGAIGPGAKEAMPALLAMLPKDGGFGYSAGTVGVALAKIDGAKPEATRALLLSSGKCTPILLVDSTLLHEYTEQVVGHLVALCADKDAKVREKAATVVATLADAPRVPFATLYARAGAGAKFIPAALEKMLDDDSAEVRLAAAKAIVRVAPELTDKALSATVALAVADSETVKKSEIHAHEVLNTAPEKAAKLLIPLLGSGNDRVRAWAINHVSYLPTRELIEETLQYGKTARIRAGAAVALGGRYSNGAASVPALKAALKDGEFTVRFAAAVALVQVGTRGNDANTAAVPVLVEALQHKDEQVRLDASQNLLSVGPVAKDAVPALKKLLGDEKPEVRLEAALALVGIDKAQATGTVPALVAGLKMGDFPARRAARALGELGPVAKDAVPELVKHLGAKDGHLRLRAAEAVGVIDPTLAPKSVDALVGLLKDKKLGRGMIRSYALVALQRIGPAAKGALPTLAELLTDEGPFHADVARAMIAIDPDGAKPAYEWVRAVLTDKSRDEDAYDLLERLPELGAQAKPLVPELVKLLQSKPAFFRENAVITLAAIGPGAKDALPELKKVAAGDRQDDIRKLAAEAVNKIEGK